MHKIQLYLPSLAKEEIKRYMKALTNNNYKCIPKQWIIKWENRIKLKKINSNNILMKICILSKSSLEISLLTIHLT